MIEDANKGKKDADEAYEDAVDVIEEGWEETVDLAEDGARAVKEGTKDAIEAIVDVDWAAAPEAVVEGSEEAIRGINGALPCRRAARRTLMDATRATSARCWAAR